MKQMTETFHTLEAREKRCGEWTIWRRAAGCVCRDAELLAYQGRLVEAIEEAQRGYIHEHGHMHGIEFRCVTKSTTITVACGKVCDCGQDAHE